MLGLHAVNIILSSLYVQKISVPIAVARLLNQVRYVDNLLDPGYHKSTTAAGYNASSGIM